MSGFLLLKKHCEGSAADIYVASDERTQARVLLEVMRPGLVKDDAAYGRFVDLARKRSALSHPGLVRVTETRCRSDGAVVAVTEPVEGVDLGEWVRRYGAVEPAQLERLMGPVCEALDYLHRRGVVHGSVSPAWIFVDGDRDAPVPRLLESGLALLRVSGLAQPPAPSVLVPADHLSPERIRGARATAAADIYALGVVMFECVTGAPPFRRSDPEATRRAHLEAPVPPLPPSAESLWPVVSRCLEKDPARRFTDALQVKEALAEALAARTRPMRKLDSAPASDPIIVGVPLGAEAVPARAEAPPKTSEPMLGQWVLERPLGEGGMGKVWLGRHASMGRKVAIKVLKRHWLEEPAQVARFMREAKVVAHVRHPNVVEVLDCGQEPEDKGGDVYIVLELLHGKSLSQLGRAGQVGVARAVRLVREAALGLHAAHLLGVVHRDVKPDNLFVCDAGEPGEHLKVVDFGVARLTHSVLRTIERTREGLVVGTPAYMAPEQSAGDPATPRADVYALATVLYALLAGRLPFDGKSPEELMVKRFREKPRKLGPETAWGERIPPGLWPVLARALTREPQDRVEDMLVLRDLLEPFEREQDDEPRGLLQRARDALAR